MQVISLKVPVLKQLLISYCLKDLILFLCNAKPCRAAFLLSPSPLTAGTHSELPELHTGQKNRSLISRAQEEYVRLTNI